MKFIRSIFRSVTPAYLIRAYVIGLIFLAFMISMLARNPKGIAIESVAMFSLCTLLFPFSKIVWDEIRDLMLGNNMFVLPAVPLIGLKLVVNFTLWVCSVFVAPIGILYLWLRRPKSPDFVP